ncbi:MAG: carboxypeptidase-like regulatory domain-containing protein [Pyrinomonadaceae bacterium]
MANSVPSAQAVLVINSADPGIGSAIPSSGSFSRQSVTLVNDTLGSGYGSISLAIPNTSALIGQTLFARWYIPDAAAPNGFSVSQLASFTIFGDAIESRAFSISGRVLTPGGLGLRNAVVILTDAAGVSRRVTTSSFGFYSFETISSGAGYTIGVASKRYRFASKVLNLSGNLTDFDFIGLE